MTNNSDSLDERSPLQRLVDKYPRLFHGQHPRVISCIPPGWVSLVERLCGQIDEIVADDARIDVLQIKEKFGALRLHYSLERKEIGAQTIIVEYEAAKAQKTHDEMASIVRRVRGVVVAAELVSVGICVGCGARARMRYFLPRNFRGEHHYFTEGDVRIPEVAGLGLHQLPMCDAHAEAHGRGEA